MNSDIARKALDVALIAAKNAGTLLQKKQKDLLLHGYSSIGVGTKSGPHDYASDADREAQTIIVDAIQKHFPDHRILGEEGGTDHLGDPVSPYRWIIDPLDGTTNFIHGKPNYGTIIALQENDETILGVMIRHDANETYTAIRGEGTFLNGMRCTLRKTAGLDDAILACNISHRAHKTPGGVLVVPIPFCASIENYGNAIEEFAVVLKGWNDGVFFNGPKLWDTVAGCLMIEEAGGKSRTELKESGNPRSGVLCAATTKEIFEEVERFVFETLKS
ncbi:MAG: myo-inositol-1(or 4)-monophosphatase [Candidatus Peregrinibacteria bacterium Greene1014_49]|nr:MAG: myo-inositol-1(or 4)-monophosphatase [Candidatus Peregrinibacteria bacterium Greene1014_49]